MPTVKSSGSLSLNEIHIAAGGTSGTQVSMNDNDIRSLSPAVGKTLNTGSQQMRGFNDFFGATSAARFTVGWSHPNASQYPHRGIGVRTGMFYYGNFVTAPVFGSQPAGGPFGTNGAFGFSNLTIDGWAYYAFPAPGTPQIKLYWLTGHPYTDPITAGATGMTVTGSSGSFSWTFASASGPYTAMNNINQYYIWQSQNTNWSNVNSQLGSPFSGDTLYLDIY